VSSRVGVADVLSSTADEGEVRCSLGYQSDGRGVDATSPFWGLDGFIARPNDPNDDGSAQALYLQDANRRYVLGVRDNRFASLVGSMDPGDRCIVTDGEARAMVKQVRDAVVLYTVNQPVDATMMVELSGQDGTLTMTNGRSFLVMKDDSITLGVGNAQLSLHADGTVQIDGGTFVCATAGGQLGTMAPMSPPMPAPAASILYGPTGVAGVASTRWTIIP